MLPGCLLLQRCNHYPYCCCWLLLPAAAGCCSSFCLFVCWSVLSGLCIFVLREEEGLQERKKERKKEERVAYSVVVVVAC
jgi:hypothetical protein